MSVYDLMIEAGKHQLNLQPNEVAGILLGSKVTKLGPHEAARIREFALAHADEIEHLIPSEARPNECSLIGMLAGYLPHDPGLAKLLQFGFGCVDAEQPEGQYGRGAFNYARRCSASGSFGDHSFDFAQDCSADGYFGLSSFARARRCRAKGTFEALSFIGAADCMVSGEFGKYDRGSYSNIFGGNMMVFGESLAEFALNGPCIILYKTGKMDEVYSQSKLSTPGVAPGEDEAIIMGIGYDGDNSHVARVLAEDVPPMDATDDNFPYQVIGLVRIYFGKAPAWAEQLAGV